jgi:hypothetical protein
VELGHDGRLLVLNILRSAIAEDAGQYPSDKGGPMLSVRANAPLIIGPEPESDRCQVAMNECESPMRGTGEQQPQPTLSNPYASPDR